MSAPRKKRPAANRSTSESVICAITRMCRPAKKRFHFPCAASSPDWDFKSCTTSPFDARSAGPRLKMSVANRHATKVAATAVPSGVRSVTSAKLKVRKSPSNELWRNVFDHMLIRIPSPPPSRASTNPSISN